MLNEFKILLKKNKVVDAITRIIAHPFFVKQYRDADTAMHNRKKGKVDTEYHWIKDYKDKYNGERCFIVATGPSLTMEDLDLIKNEYSFAMNSCVLALDKTDWRPQFYMIQDEYVYEKLEDELVNGAGLEMEQIWVTQNIKKQFNVPQRFKSIFLHYLNHKMFSTKLTGKIKFSDDCYAGVYDAYSVIFSIMQMACYMGFKKICLLGCDCNYDLPKAHFIESGHVGLKANMTGEKLLRSHAAFKKFAIAQGVEVINCTRGGMLEVYARRSLEEIL